MIIIDILFTLKNNVRKMGHKLQPIYVYWSFRLKYIKDEGLTLT